MGRATRWSRVMLAAMLPLLVLGVSLLARRAGERGILRRDAAARRASDPIAGTMALHLGRRRRLWAGGVDSDRGNFPGRFRRLPDPHVGMVNLDLLSGAERWRLTADWLEGEASTSAAADSGLDHSCRPPKVVYAFDDSTGAAALGLSTWVRGEHPGYRGNRERHHRACGRRASLTGIERRHRRDGLAADAAGQTRFPIGKASTAVRWSRSGSPKPREQNVQAFGIDKSTGALLWQTPVGQTAFSSGGR